jgi:hypothetical protein
MLVLVCGVGCGGDVPPPPLHEQTEAAEVAELGRLIDQLRIAIPERDARGPVRSYSMSHDQAREAGLTLEEAKFEGSWHHSTWGLDVLVNHTFTLLVHGPPNLSSGTWSVADGKLRLEHTRFRGRSLFRAVVSEHSLADLERALHGPNHEKGIEEIRALHRKLMELLEKEPAPKPPR